jgi:hypothetical protein
MACTVKEGPKSGIYAVQHSEGGRFFGEEKKKDPPQGCGARIGGRHQLVRSRVPANSTQLISQEDTSQFDSIK